MMSEPSDRQGLAAKRLVVHYRTGATETLEPTMAALAYAERQGITPLASNAYMLAVSFYLLRHEVPESTWEEWADRADPVKIEEQTADIPPATGSQPN